MVIAQKLPEIFSLARERSEAARMRLAGLLADVFLQSEGLNQREQLLVNEIIDELVGNTTPQVKQMLAEKLAASTNVPHRVLLNLASDSEISIAGPVLKQNGRLRDEDLIYIVEAHGADHALSVSERAAISEAVVDALIATGEIDVMKTVAENFGAKISPRAMHAMIEAAHFSKKLHEPLVKRPELTPDMSLRLLWWTSTELRRVIVKRFGIGAGQIDLALENSIGDLLTNVEADRNDETAMSKVAEWLEERDAVNPRTIIQALRMGFFRLFGILLSRRTGLDIALIEYMISEDGGRSLSVLARSLNVDKATFVSMFLLSRGSRPGEQIVNPRELSLAIAAFDRLDMKTAQSLINDWKKDPSYIVGRMNKPLH